MSAALTLAERNALADVVVAMTTLGATDKARMVADLVARLARLSHCDSCGVLYDGGSARAPYCHHCLDEMRREDARAATGEDLR